VAPNEELRTYIAKEVLKNDNIEISEESRLIQDGLINSIGIMKLVTFLSDRFGVQFEDDDYKIENFETLSTIQCLIERRSTTATA